MSGGVYYDYLIECFVRRFSKPIQSLSSTTLTAANDHPRPLSLALLHTDSLTAPQHQHQHQHQHHSLTHPLLSTALRKGEPGLHEKRHPARDAGEPRERPGVRDLAAVGALQPDVDDVVDDAGGQVGGGDGVDGRGRDAADARGQHGAAEEREGLLRVRRGRLAADEAVLGLDGWMCVMHAG